MLTNALSPTGNITYQQVKSEAKQWRHYNVEKQKWVRLTWCEVILLSAH